MKIKALTSLILITLLVQSNFFAFETDQYNLPPQPLADIGDEVSEYTESVVKQSVNKVNNEIITRQKCLDNPTKECDSIEKNLKKLEYLRSDDAVAHEIYEVLGSGIPPFTSSGSWMESHQFRESQVRYKINYRKSIFVFFPTSYIGLASTVNLYNSQFGTDKIAHFFQEGYDYFKIYRESLKKGFSPSQATEKAVKWGQKTEKGIYGTWISGVYSNADLFANYVGLKFYIGLTQNIRIGEINRPPVLKLETGLWKLNEDFKMSDILLKPFISNHLNEALNPSIFTQIFGLRAYVRRVLKKQACQEWQTQFPHISSSELEKTSKELTVWNGENYGFTNSKNFVTIANTCFDSTIAKSD